MSVTSPALFETELFINGIERRNEMQQSILDAVRAIPEDEGIKLVEPYYDPQQPYTGAYFELIGSDDKQPDRFTAADLYAVSMLAVPVPAKAGIGILLEQAEQFDSLLSRVPDVHIKDLNAEDFERHLGPDSVALELWDRLRRNGATEERWKVGPTTASKIMARKRPHLIPIEDSVVDHVTQRGKRDSWEMWWQAFRDGDGYLEARADQIRAAVNRPDLSTLRVFDVMLWSWGKEQGY